MGEIQRIDGLELGQDLTYQKWEWRLERVGWVLLLLLVVAALLGLLGPGPLSHTTAEANGIRLDYDRFLHRHAVTALRIEVETGDAEELSLWLEQAYLAEIQIKEVTPPPVRVEVGQERHTYIFRLNRPRTRASIVIRFEPENPGRVQGQIGSGSTAVPVRHFVYP